MTFRDKNKVGDLYFKGGKGGLLRSGFGSQPISDMSTAPMFGFGHSPREATTKLYLSTQHDKALCYSSGGNNSKGPIYGPVSSIGVQWISKHSSAPMPKFGKSNRSQIFAKENYPGPGSYENGRDKVTILKSGSGAIGSRSKFGKASREKSAKVFISAEHEKVFFGMFSPGPCSYNPRNVFGKQTLSRLHSAPSWKVGSEKRFNYPSLKVAAGIPGAGNYDVAQSYKKSVLSKTVHAPCFKFSKAIQSGTEKIYISREHEKGLLGRASPGPTTAVQISGKHPCLKYSGDYVFGKSKREMKYGNAVPGPGAYAS